MQGALAQVGTEAQKVPGPPTVLPTAGPARLPLRSSLSAAPASACGMRAPRRENSVPEAKSPGGSEG